VLSDRSAVGLMVTVLPLTVTLVPVTAMVSTTVLSETFLITILPVPLATASLKLTTKLAPTAILVALSTGVKLLAVGALVSAVVKFQAAAPVIPA
jgi:hypothetical protein